MARTINRNVKPTEPEVKQAVAEQPKAQEQKAPPVPAEVRNVSVLGELVLKDPAEVKVQIFDGVLTIVSMDGVVQKKCKTVWVVISGVEG